MEAARSRKGLGWRRGFLELCLQCEPPGPDYTASYICMLIIICLVVHRLQRFLRVVSLFEVSSRLGRIEADQANCSNFASDTLGAGHRNVVNNLEGVSEAVGGVNILTLHLDDEDPNSVDEDKSDELYPELKFNGHSATPNNSHFTGSVKLLPSGDRHWTFIITYGGAERWITQGIEIGMRGVYGMWSDVLHEELSP